MLPTTTPGLAPPALRTLREMPTATSSCILMRVLRFCNNKASQHTSSWTLVSHSFAIWSVTVLMFMLARNGVQPTAQQAWGDWCNLIGTGFGVRPTTNTGNALEDAFVWIKPGGEGDVSLLPPFFCPIQLTRVIAGYLRHLLRQIRCSLRSCRCAQACPRSRYLVPGLLRAIAHQRQPSILEGELEEKSRKTCVHCARLLQGNRKTRYCNVYRSLPPYTCI
jgi:hypothetical protein